MTINNYVMSIGILNTLNKHSASMATHMQHIATGLRIARVADDPAGDHVYLVNNDGEQHFAVHGKVGYPFFGQLILDCIHRTENAMTQAHAFKAAELCLQAQAQAVVISK